MTRQESILNYVSMAGTDLSFKNITKRQAIEKVYFLCKTNKLKATRKVITDLVNLEIKANESLKGKTPEDSCRFFKQQKEYFFYNQKA